MVTIDDDFLLDDSDVIVEVVLPEDIDAELSSAQQRVEMLRATGLLILPGDVTELRALHVEAKWGKGQPWSGYFDNMEALAGAALELGKKAQGVYILPAPLPRVLLSRRNNRVLVAERDSTTGDNLVERRSSLLVDLDPKRISGISSTRGERDAALVRAQDIRSWLGDSGWPEPLYASSGNGAHLVFRIDLPRDDGGLVERCLKALHTRFSDNVVEVDVKVGNPARIWKLYGSKGRKGDSTPERPHRFSRIIEAPDVLAVVPTELLERLAEIQATQPPAPTPAIPAPRATPSAAGTVRRASSAALAPARKVDIDAFVAKHLPEADGPHPWQGGRKWVVQVCPFDSAHDNAAAFVVEFANGAIAAGCHHNGCAGKGWPDLRVLFEPDAYAPRPKPALRVVKREDEAANAHVPDFVDLDDPPPSLEAELDAPWAERLVVPGSYRVTRRMGVEELDLDRQASLEGKVIVPVPLVLRGRSQLINGGVRVQTAWVGRVGWRDRWLDRGDIANPRRLLDAADYGLPVDARNVQKVSAYLCDFERANDAHLPTALQTPGLGWINDDAFMLPDGLVTTPDYEGDKAIALAPVDGAEAFIAAHHAKGTIEGWSAALSGLEAYPGALFMFYAAFTPPILRILRLLSFILDLSAATSTGKTSGKRFAASGWGMPQPDGGIIGTWSISEASLERHLGVLGSIPIFLDDTMAAKDKNELSKKIYLVSNGRGSGRAMPVGLQTTDGWRTVCISSGEAPITSFSEHGGARARCLLLTEPPFGTEASAAGFVDKALAGIGDNYGHAGPALVRWLLANKRSWPSLRKHHQRIRDSLLASGDPGAVRRAADSAAAVIVAGRLLHGAVPLPWKFTDPLPALWPEMKLETASGKRGETVAVSATVSRRTRISWRRCRSGVICQRCG